MHAPSHPSHVSPVTCVTHRLQADPLEKVNLAHPLYKPNHEQAAAFVRLQSKLADVIATRLQPLPGTRVPFDVSGKTVGAPLVGHAGTVTGVPVASSRVTLAFKSPLLGGGSSDATLFDWKVSSEIGEVRGTANASPVGGVSNALGAKALRGTASITSGSGVFLRLTGNGLAFEFNTTVLGLAGQLAINGEAVFL